MEYKEIFKLKEMFEKAKIPFVFEEVKELEGYQIFYPKGNRGYWTPEIVCSVVEHGCSYGNENDRLEIMGLLTERERKYDSVCGYLTARKVFNRIKSIGRG